MKNYLLLLVTFVIISNQLHSQLTGPGSRMGEVFQRTDLVDATPGLNDPWEITYGSDGKLWITESKGYKIQRLDPSTGTGTTVLDLATISPNSWRKTWTSPAPQGGLMGLALHPDFMDPVTPKKYVYIAYVHDYVGQNQTYKTEYVSGHLFRTWLVRFTFNGTSLVSPIAICDTITGSNDHNSGRLIIKPEPDGKNYLFYAVGDMGAGQFDNQARTNKAQFTNSYEGKILRFNLEQDLDTDLSDKWIPNDNPYTAYGKKNAVYAIGIRNNQGFAYGVVNGVGRLYGSSHGPFSDDELNLIDKAINYGHPNVIGYNDGNYDGAKAGPLASNLPAITNENTYITNTIGAANYGEPLYSFYAAPKGTSTTLWTIQHIYTNANLPVGHPKAGNKPQNENGYWASEGVSGMDIYTNSMIPGWKNSILTGTLKGGKILRLQLNPDGLSVKKTAPYDTIGILRSPNRFRDIAFSPDGKSMFAVIDRSSSTSGPTTDNPIISACAGCVQKYTFLGYENIGNTSSLPDIVDIAAGTPNSCQAANTININTANNNYWVPITDNNSNIVAEIKANGNNLGNVSTSLYVKTGSLREYGLNKLLYLNRSLTITPQTQPNSDVNLRIYLTEQEFLDLKDATNSLNQPSGITGVSNLGIFKNSDPCAASITGAIAPVINNYQLTRNSNGYVLHVTISSFSTFYIANSTALLPLGLIKFNGNLVNGVTQLKWITQEEENTVNYIVQRSLNGLDFDSIATVKAQGGSFKHNYQATDPAVTSMPGSKVFYRLKVNDVNGGYSYSDIVSIGLNNKKGTVTARPNPVYNLATIDINAIAAESVKLDLTDNTGKVIKQIRATVSKGNNSININMSMLQAGMYYLKVSGTHISQVVKLQKL
ncbi:PQQ-dependent sugar dehydrogenase [Flavitalea sp.]|nr:PQQ-dependent sugar dehydrogenase [Flavitalea sp.]